MDKEQHTGPSLRRLLILDELNEAAGSSPAASAIAALLVARGYDVVAAGAGSQDLGVLDRLQPDVVLMWVPREMTAGDFHAAARERGIPILDLIESRAELATRTEQFDAASDWWVRDGDPEELAARIAQLLRRPAPAPIETKFSSLIVHDLRGPLNVIKLSLRMIEPVLPPDDRDVAEDFRFIEDNVRQLERMITQLGGYARLFEPGLELSVSEFDPRRLVEELLENFHARAGAAVPAVHLEVQKTCPAEATLDQTWARTAIEYALENATAAAQGEPVRLTLRGEPELNRWLIEVAIDQPAPASVQSTDLRAHSFERMCGAAAERRGMDLAIAARVSALFGGRARLEATPGQGTTILLDWPARIGTSASAAST